MHDLANIQVEVPISLLGDWSGHFEYATSNFYKGELFQSNNRDSKYIQKGQWIEKGDILYVMPMYNVHVISPISGLVKGGGSPVLNLVIQPVKNFILPENCGEMLFREVVGFIHRIEREIIEYQNKSGLAKMIQDIRYGRPFPESRTWNYSSDRRKALLEEADKLLEAKCIIKEIDDR